MSIRHACRCERDDSVLEAAEAIGIPPQILQCLGYTDVEDFIDQPTNPPSTAAPAPSTGAQVYNASYIDFLVFQNQTSFPGSYSDYLLLNNTSSAP